MTLECKFCGKECKNDNSLRNHERLCKNNPNRQTVKNNFSEWNKRRKELGIAGENQFTKAKRLGISVPIVSEETKEKIRQKQTGRRHTEDEKNKISESIKLAIKRNPESYSSCNVNGRVKVYNYNGITLNGKWELDVAAYLDANAIKWERPKDGIPYMMKNESHLYFPDFYLVDYNTFIEVKGYIREKDPYKWSAVKNLIIITAKDIKSIRSGSYNIFEKLGPVA